MSTGKVLVLAAAIAVFLLWTAAPASAAHGGAHVVVNSAGDTMANDGVCTLREAITAVESNSTQDQCVHDGSTGTDTIHFNIPGPVPHTIQPNPFLPVINSSVTIDATTQPGFVTSPVIVLNGNGSNASAFTIQGNGTTIRGFAIGNFVQPGITVSAGDNNTIVGNYIGVGADGTSDFGNGVANTAPGISICCEAENNTIGGSTAANRNVISGNDNGQIFVHSSNNAIKGNYIGTNASGTGVLPGSWGVLLFSGSGNQIGGGGAGEGNVLAGNTQANVQFQGTATGNALVGNRIGVGPTGNPLTNPRRGVVISGSSAVNNAIGGTGPGEGNIIASHAWDGIQINSASGVPIQGNSIHSNGFLGIDLGFGTVSPNDVEDPDSGANNLQNFPDLVSAEALAGSSALIEYSFNSVPSSKFQLEFFVSDACNAAAPNDYGEGQAPLGFTGTVTTDGAGNHSGTFTSSGTPAVDVGDRITATATRLDSATEAPIETSEFSQCETVVANEGPTDVAMGPLPPFSLSPSIALSWTGTDPHGPVSYEVEVKTAPYNGDFGGYEPVHSGTETEMAFDVSPGDTYCFRVTATVALGGSSPPTEDRCTAAPVDSTSLQHKQFAKKSIAGAYMGTASVGRQRNARLTLSDVRADQLVLIVSKCPTCGVVKVSFDGITKRWNTQGPMKRQAKWVVADFGSVRTGTVKIVKPRPNGRVIVEGLGVSAV